MQLYELWHVLPDRTAVHFGAGGRPNRWSHKAEMVGTLAVAHVLSVLLFVGTRWLLRRIPDAYINLPNKAYWLAPERRERSFLLLGRTLMPGAWLTQALLLAVGESVAAAHRLDPVRLPDRFLWAVGIYMGAVAAWSAWLIWWFGRRP